MSVWLEAAIGGFDMGTALKFFFVAMSLIIFRPILSLLSLVCLYFYNISGDSNTTLDLHQEATMRLISRHPGAIDAAVRRPCSLMTESTFSCTDISWSIFEEETCRWGAEPPWFTKGVLRAGKTDAEQYFECFFGARHIIG